MRFLKSILILLSFSLFLCGCSNDVASYSVSKQLISNKDWDVYAFLVWDDEKVTGITEAQYKGSEPLEFVQTEPNFTVGKWPEGYIPPGSGKYTWNSGKPQGEIPHKQEIRTMKTSFLKKKPPV